MIPARVLHVSILLPNLDDLLAQLPAAATPAVRDARAVAEAAASASTVDELDQVLGALVMSWRQA